MDAGLSPTQGDPLGAGEVLADRYVIRARLGSGGMGMVFRVFDRELEEEIALKVLHADQAWDAESLVRFRREAKLARRITHRCVARTYDFGRHGPLQFLTMELIEGTSLGERMRAPVPLAEALRICTEVGRGLAAAHAQGVVHRDLKPDNVLLAGDRVVITDFGIARAEHDVLATSGAIVGTPAYMAPEQLSGGALDGRADVYALGVVLYQLVTGALPFQGDTPFSMAAARLSLPPPDPRGVTPSIPECVARLALDALARRREDRPDAQAFTERLESVRGAGSGPRHVTPVTPTALTAADVSPLADLHSVRIDPIDADAASAQLAGDLVLALRDALASERTVHVVTEGGETAITGELRVAAGRVRLRARQVARTGAVLWSTRLEGATDDPFDLEDRFVAEITRAVRLHGDRRGGPSDPAVRARWAHAMELLYGLDLTVTREALEIFEGLHREAPHEPSIMAGLALALVQVWLQMSGADPMLAARAEELALRARDADPRLADAAFAMARIRMVNGDLRAAVFGLREVLSLAPTHAPAHFALGVILCDVGQTDAGLRRMEVARRLGGGGGLMLAGEVRARTLAGQHAQAAALVQRARGTPDLSSLVPVLAEICAWTDDRGMAAEVAGWMADAPPDAQWASARPLLEALSRGERTVELLAQTRAYFSFAAAAPIASWHRALMSEIGAAHVANLGGDEDDVLTLVEAAAAQASCLDLAWFDRVPCLARVRSHPRFAAARALVAARIADLAL